MYEKDAKAHKQAYINNHSSDKPLVSNTLEDGLLAERWKEEIDYKAEPLNDHFYFLTYAYSIKYTEVTSRIKRELFKIGRTQVSKYSYHSNINALDLAINIRFNYLNTLLESYDKKQITLFNHGCFSYSHPLKT